MVATATPAYLHRLYWAVPDGAPQDDESLIGELPSHWNWLVDWYPNATADAAKLVRAHTHTVSLRDCARTGAFHRRWTLVSRLPLACQ
jgi:hypothetical protein